MKILEPERGEDAAEDFQTSFAPRLLTDGGVKVPDACGIKYKK